MLFLLFQLTDGIGQSFDPEECLRLITEYKDDSLKLYLDATEEVLIDDRDKINHYYYSAKYFRFNNNKSEQLENLEKGYGLVLKQSDEDAMRALFFDEYAILYRIEKNNVKALEYINESLALKKKKNESRAKSLMIKANIFSEQGKYDEALTIYDSVIDLTINLQEKDNYFLARRNIAKTHKLRGRLDLAEREFRELIAERAARKELKAEMQIRRSLLELLIEKGAFVEADVLLDELMALCKNKKWMADYRDAVISKINLLDSLGQYEASIRWRDTLTVIDAGKAQEKIDDLLVKSKLHSAIAKEELAAGKNKFWFYIFASSFALASLFLLGLYKYISVKRQATSQKLEMASIKSTFDSTIAKMKGEQKERENIAAILHDQVASLLTAADMHVKVAHKKAPDLEGLKKAGNLIKDVNEQVRELSHQLVSPTLIKFGLVAGLQTLADRMRTNEFNVVFHSYVKEVRYSTMLENFIFQSCVELIKDSLENTGTDFCSIELSSTNTDLCLTLTNNGQYLDSKTYLGNIESFKHIYNRCQALGGNFEFKSNNSAGWSLLTLPLNTA